MTTDTTRVLPSTTPSVAAVAQSRGGGRAPPGSDIGLDLSTADFGIGPRVLDAGRTRPYERDRDDPVYRPLRIFTLDPLASRLDGAVAVVNTPYEPLGPGPVGALLRVDPLDAGTNQRCRSVDLDDPANLIRQGRAPSTTDPEFHQQMAYAVCSIVYAAFRRALGRDVAWSFDRLDADGRRRLLLRPLGGEMRNAWYDKESGSLVFGYFAKDAAEGDDSGYRGHVFTGLSHDILVHETTHALLDGLRAHFSIPTNRDVLAFHEAFADLVALFQHFSYRTVVEAGIRTSQGNIETSDLLLGLAREFGEAGERNGPMRRALGTMDLKEDHKPPQYGQSPDEPHERGAVLVAAVFEAFLKVYRRKVGRYVRLATQGSGLIVGDLPVELQGVMAEEASQLADQFLSICIRAIDFCPPVDIEFGEFLRAMITADYELVPDDPHAYREALINAFRRRGIHPPDVPGLSEDALLWRPPERRLPPIEDLSFRRLAFDGDPARPAGDEELERQATAFGRFAASPDVLDLFGLARAGDPRLGGDRIEPPMVESIRSCRRVGPDGQILFDLVAEITQRRIAKGPGGGFEFLGGATAILGPRGEIRYTIAKSVLNERRLERQRRFLAGPAGNRLWVASGGRRIPAPQLFRLCHSGE